MKPTDYIGKFGTFNVPIKGAEPCGFIVPIRIVDVKHAFGRIDLKIEPQGGEGAAWVTSKLVTIPKT